MGEELPGEDLICVSAGESTAAISSTYEFYVKENADSALSRLLANFQDRIMDDPDIAPLLANSSYSLKEIVIMASLIEKETDGTDRAVISSVIHSPVPLRHVPPARRRCAV